MFWRQYNSPIFRAVSTPEQDAQNEATVNGNKSLVKMRKARHLICLFKFYLMGLTLRFCFRFEMIEPPDMGWGSLVNGRWTGITGMLVEKVGIYIKILIIYLPKDHEFATGFASLNATEFFSSRN